MSVPTSRQAFAFLGPLRGRTSVFITPSRRRNSNVARFLLGCLAASRTRTIIFDTSSFYGTNIRKLTESLPKDFLQQSALIAPQEGLVLEESLAELLDLKTGAILIDDLNALHHLLSSDRRNSGIRQLFTFLRLLSYQARINGTSVLVTLYRAEPDSTPAKHVRRSLSAAADLQVSTDDNSGRITFRCSEVKGWPNSVFSAPVYF
jgi:hypothetical protein